MSNYITEIVKDSVTYNIKDEQIVNKMDKVNPTGTGTFTINGSVSGANAIALGQDSISAGDYSLSCGSDTVTTADYSHAEGDLSYAEGECSHAEGYFTEALGDYSHAEGNNSIAVGGASHAEGIYTNAEGNQSHAEGYYSHAEGQGSHAEGASSTGSDSNYSHAEGKSTHANGTFSHAEGYSTFANGNMSHAEGCETKAYSDYQHVQGKYNVVDSSGTYIDIVGNGTSESARKNISALTVDGDLRLKGTVYLNCNDDSTGGTPIITNQAKLVAKSGTQVVIERDGLIETYVEAYSSTNNGGIRVQNENTTGYPFTAKVLRTPNNQTVYRIGKPGFIYGIQPGTTIAQLSNLIEIVNGGSYTIYNGSGQEKSITDSSINIGTGFNLRVLNSNKVCTEEFYFIIFGDTTGDGLITTSDKDQMTSWNTTGDFPSRLNGYDYSRFRSADLNQRDNIDQTDINLIMLYLNGQKGIYQTNGMTYLL